ncbi:subunit Brf1 of transcription factor TFIIIB complex [Mitosporidium daphniae]|uniref:B-related factor 1 n=1 Tax=Mitosporidium daphniae TaxID=1485682 RepID=A0A098VR90_9MICR|nr:subunit Brf1 of transcription factor TFIIIB complex [Mitosporidium daphniae]KGG51450.1 subunit Brf1 of transcription factor TFIIIB complex [Mitosporidium daphniae]|eukprot:XP_013237904.1 subunit Brf1 of transcription factor TFIIIB complex [Mitosporidium daphniae]
MNAFSSSVPSSATGSSIPSVTSASGCLACGANEIEYDQAQGNSFCTICGTVLEENAIVSEITFSESASGASVMQGQFVPEKSTALLGMLGGVMPLKGGVSPGSSYRRYQPSDSREVTICQARLRLQALGFALGMSEHHINAAHRWFILAYQHQFTRGRRSQAVAAGCLYIVCRQEKTPHMLLDFSDVLRVNVFALGSVFLKLCRLLNLDLPLVDPSLYIGRFASRLEFGEKTSMVTATALRLVSRMKRDWIQTGRRPAGVCGACLLIAARIYGFSRSQKEILAVVRVCDMTLRRRLEEFSRTPSSKLTPEEFHGVWLEEEIDPPSFSLPSLAKKKDRIKSEHMRIFEEQRLAQLLLIDPRLLNEDPISDLSILDVDEEVSSALLAEAEMEAKSVLWHEANKDYILQQEEKAQFMLEQEKLGISQPPVKRSTRKRKQEQYFNSAEGPSSSHLTPSEAAKTLISSNKKLSKKFNYQVLDSLLETPASIKLS